LIPSTIDRKAELLMQLHLESDLIKHLEKTKPFLEEQRTLHSFILGVSQRHLEIQKPMKLLAHLFDATHSVKGTAIQTDALYPLILSKCAEEVAGQFAQLLSERIDHLPGVNGPAVAAEAFAKKWSTLKQTQRRLSTNLRLFELRKISPVTNPPGAPRLAMDQDRQIVFQWLHEFQKEAVPNDPIASDEDLFKSIDSSITKKQLFIWEDQEKAVCLLGSRRQTETERWIAPVYTPPELRGRGYGTALTAYASEQILRSGKLGMLFTDLANPTSNSIYQKIGYSPVSDFKHFIFE